MTLHLLCSARGSKNGLWLFLWQAREYTVSTAIGPTDRHKLLQIGHKLCKKHNICTFTSMMNNVHKNALLASASMCTLDTQNGPNSRKLVKAQNVRKALVVTRTHTCVHI